MSRYDPKEFKEFYRRTQAVILGLALFYVFVLLLGLDPTYAFFVVVGAWLGAIPYTVASHGHSRRRQRTENQPQELPEGEHR